MFYVGGSGIGFSLHHFCALWPSLYYPRYPRSQKTTHNLSSNPSFFFSLPLHTTFPHHYSAACFFLSFSSNAYYLKGALNRALGFGIFIIFFGKGGGSMRVGWERGWGGLMCTQDYGWDSGKRFQGKIFFASHTHIQIFAISKPALEPAPFLKPPRLLSIYPWRWR